MSVRVRFAPSPTGYLHIGGLRTALYNWLFARHLGGTFILRIEDTDRTRLVADGVARLLQTLTILDLRPDEGPQLTPDGVSQRGPHPPYIQSDNLAHYQKSARELVASEHAYWCDCSPQRLAQLRSTQSRHGQGVGYDGHCRDRQLSEQGRGVIRLKVPRDELIELADIVHGKVVTNTREIDDQVLLKSDGFPTYHLANVVDDHRMEITHVIRGDEWLPSTPKHILLYRAFGWSSPQFGHLPLLLAPGGGKLSKRMGDVAVEDFLSKGYLPETLFNFVALLGWNPRGDQELYSRAELIAGFDLARVNKNGTVINYEKLDWMNAHYIKNMSFPTFRAYAETFLSAVKSVAPPEQFYRLEQRRIHRFNELPQRAEVLLTPAYDPQLLSWKQATTKTVMSHLQAVYEVLVSYDDTVFEDSSILERTLKDWIEKNGIERGAILWPLRVALSGKEKSPSPFELASVIGKQDTLARIQNALKLLTT